MEARRLSILCSHLRQIDSGRSSLQQRPESNCFSWISTSNCASTGSNDQRLRDSNKESEEKDCVFCKISRGESPAFKLYEDDICLCILDLNPLSHGHSLIIPKCHFSSLKATPPSVIASMCSIVPLVSDAIMKATHCDSFNLLVNCGAAAGQVIFHTHLHIIPRKAHDPLWKSESLRRQPLKLDQETAQLADCIRQQLSYKNKNSVDGDS